MLNAFKATVYATPSVAHHPVIQASAGIQG